MKPKTWVLLILIGMIVVGGGVFLLKQVLLLELDNTDQPKTIRVRIDPSERVSFFYIHSIYQEAVTEEFQADRDGIVLKGVRTKSPAIQEYYGFQDLRDFHPLNVKLGAIFVRVGQGEGQGLIVRDRKIYLSEVGKRGDRVRLRVTSLSLGSYLFSQIFK